MIILYSDFKQPISSEVFKRYLEQVSESCKERTESFRHWFDGYTYLFGKILVMHGMRLMGRSLHYDQIMIDQFGRPYVNYEIDFNISHSDNFVACILSKNSRVGIDIEKVENKVDLEVYNSLFSDSELTIMYNANNPQHEFYRLWTIKESVLKADGRGLAALNLLSEIGENEELTIGKSHVWFFQNVFINPSLQCTIACNKPIGSYKLIKIDF